MWRWSVSLVYVQYLFAVYTFNSHHHHHHRGKRKIIQRKPVHGCFQKYQQVGVCYRALLSLSFLPSPSIHILPVKNSFFSLLFSSRVSSTFSAASKPQKSHCRCYNSHSLTRSVLISFSNSNHKIHVVDKHLFGVFILYFIYF